MDLYALIEQIKHHPNFHKAGMILCHNGVVRATSRDGREVTGLRISVDHGKLKQIIESNKKRPGIIEILVEIETDKDLSVGDDVMFLVVAGDIRENVVAALKDTLDGIKNTATRKTQFYKSTGI
jgi:molybdopterin synthase catalytic subunit